MRSLRIVTGALVLSTLFCAVSAQDPVLDGPVWKLSGDENSVYFGQALARAGDVDGDGFDDFLVATAGTLGAGRVHLFRGGAEGPESAPDWSADGSQNNETFGGSVASAGDVNGDGYGDVIVGAPYYNGGDWAEGRALVYLGSADGLATTPVWEVEGSPDFGFSPTFGSSVASAGDVNGDGYDDIVVGAPNYPEPNLRRGAAYLYLGSAGGPSTTPAWVAEGDENGSGSFSIGGMFGDSVAGVGDVNGDGYDDLVVGAPRRDGAFTDAGQALLFLGSASGLAPEPSWWAEGSSTNEEFGRSVAGVGDINGDGRADVAVCAPRADSGQSNEGRCFFYRGVVFGLSPNPIWIVESNQAHAFQGTVSGAGDVNGDGYSDVVVGAGGFDDGQSDEGRIALHLGSATGLATTPAWTFHSDQELAGLGSSVIADVNGDGYADVLAGAGGFDDDQTDEGRVFLFTGSAGALAPTASWMTGPDAPESGIGSSVACAGDVNGDGYSDAVVGAPSYGDPEHGRAQLFLGSAGGPSATPAWTVVGTQMTERLGWCVASAGDVDGDGLDDVLVGAPQHVNGSLVGRAQLHRGTSGGLASAPAWVLEGDGVGTSLASAGDVNGDGRTDVLVGAPGYSNGQPGEGRALVFLGTATGLATSPAWAVEGNANSAQMGSWVAPAGDVDADGFGDVAVRAGALVLVYHGSPAGLAMVPAWSAPGARMANAGDVNGDGFSDIVVGDPLGAGFTGTAALYHGSASGLAAAPAWSDTGSPGEFDGFGWAVASAGDVNGDGFSDVVVGSPGHNVPGSERAFLYLGSSAGLAPDPVWTGSFGNDDLSDYGAAVSTGGDVNGDGYGDVLVGAPWQDITSDDVGRVFLYLGNEGRGGLTDAPRQRCRSLARPIALFGRSDAIREFRIRLRFETSLAGLGWGAPAVPSAWLEWQIAPLGVPLDAAPVESGTPQPLTGAPLEFDEIAHMGPTPVDRPYHWRARVRTDHPFLQVTPWTWLPWNAVSEAKLRRGRTAVSSSASTPLPPGPLHAPR